MDLPCTFTPIRPLMQSPVDMAPAPGERPATAGPRTPSVAIRAISARCRPILLRGCLCVWARFVVMAILFLPPDGGEGRPYGACGWRDRASAPESRWTSTPAPAGTPEDLRLRATSPEGEGEDPHEVEAHREEALGHRPAEPGVQD